jgi:hypothetical protein
MLKMTLIKAATQAYIIHGSRSTGFSCKAKLRLGFISTTRNVIIARGDVVPAVIGTVSQHKLATSNFISNSPYAETDRHNVVAT